MCKSETDLGPPLSIYIGVLKNSVSYEFGLYQNSCHKGFFNISEIFKITAVLLPSSIKMKWILLIALDRNLRKGGILEDVPQNLTRINKRSIYI
jgi:hypothetical protein